MTALIMKDVATLRKTLFLVVPLCILISAYGVYKGAFFMIPLIGAMIPLILTAIAYGYDVKSNFELFAFSMPIKKSSYVLSKLFFAFSFGLLAALCLFILLLVKSDMPLAYICLFSSITFVTSLLISAIQLPFVLKYGAEKGRLLMVITYFLIFALSTLLKEKAGFLMKGMEVLNKYSPSILAMGFLSLCLLLTGLAVKISITIMDKKEY